MTNTVMSTPQHIKRNRVSVRCQREAEGKQRVVEEDAFFEAKEKQKVIQPQRKQHAEVRGEPKIVAVVLGVERFGRHDAVIQYLATGSRDLTIQRDGFVAC